MAAKDYYEILGVSRDASSEDIKKAYRHLVRKYHPDVAPDKKEAEAKMAEINEAYGTLTDEEKRRYYDQFGSAPSAAGGGPAGARGFEDIFAGSGNPFGDIFSEFFGGGMGGGRQRGPRPTRGRDVQVTVHVSLEEAYRGTKRDVSFKVQETCLNCQGKLSTEPDGVVTCSACNGAGQVTRQLNVGFGTINQTTTCDHCHGLGKIVKKPCKECHGKGVVTNVKQAGVNIPAGVDTGITMRLAGKGEPGTLGGPNGNLLVVVQVDDSKDYVRDGDELRLHRRITFTDAALGSTLEVPLINGEKATIKIPAGTQSGAVFRLRGKGMPRLGESSFGDLMVMVEVMVPTKLNAKQKKLLKEFAEAGSQEAESGKSAFRKLREIKDAIFG